MTILVEDKESALKVQAGDAYVIDVWPQPPVSDEEEKTFKKRMVEAQTKSNKLQKIIDNNLRKDEKETKEAMSLVDVDKKPTGTGRPATNFKKENIK